MLWPLIRTVTVSVVPFEIARSGLSEDDGGAALGTNDADGVGDGNGAAQPATRTHTRTAAKVFISDRRCARISGRARAWWALTDTMTSSCPLSGPPSALHPSEEHDRQPNDDRQDGQREHGDAATT